MPHMGACHDLQRAPALPDLSTQTVKVRKVNNRERATPAPPITQIRASFTKDVSKRLSKDLFFFNLCREILRGSICSVQAMQLVIHGVFSAEAGAKNLRVVPGTRCSKPRAQTTRCGSETALPPF